MRGCDFKGFASHQHCQPASHTDFATNNHLYWYTNIEKRIINLSYVQHCLLRALRLFQQPMPVGVLWFLKHFHLLPASSGGLPNWLVATILAWLVVNTEEGVQEDALADFVFKRCTKQLLTFLAVCQREMAEDRHVLINVPSGDSSIHPATSCRLLFVPRTGLPPMPLEQYGAMLWAITARVPEHQEHCIRVYNRIREVFEGCQAAL